ncbi:unnamed protein product, partial [Cylindrotheca closterium]
MTTTSNRNISTSTVRSSFLPFLAGTAFGIASSILYTRVICSRNQKSSSSSSSSLWLQPPSTLPRFAQEILSNHQHTNTEKISNDDSNGESTNASSPNTALSSENWTEVRLREWEDLNWRDANGWQGRDLCHNPQGVGVRILHYYYKASSKEMVGVVWFGPHAESHRGLCHGGAMTSLMDDFCGHLAFLHSTSGQPWSGATVQVNVSLKKPVKVGSILRIIGRIDKHEGRKIYVHATLDDGGGDNNDDDDSSGGKEQNKDPVVYATLEGLSIDGVKMSQHEDPVSKRTWEVEVCEHSGRLQRR